MYRSKTVFVAIAIGLSAGLSAATVYKSVDEQGNVIYTDEPGNAARPVELPPLSTYPAPPVRALETGPDPREAAAPSVGYSKLLIARPAPEATVRDNTGRVEVQAQLQPELREEAGHRFRFYLDGKAMGEPLRTPSTSFSDVDRGAHEVEVAVVDGAGNVLKRSAAVRFYLHRQSQNFPAGPRPRVNPPVN